MVHFLLEAGADQEHKTDEMHTALMEACMVRGDTHAQTSVPYKQVFTSMTKHFSSCNEYFTSPGGKPGELSINCRKCLRVSDRDGWLLNLFPRAVSLPACLSASPSYLLSVCHLVASHVFNVTL